jgi:hypothetical protein
MHPDTMPLSHAEPAQQPTTLLLGIRGMHCASSVKLKPRNVPWRASRQRQLTSEEALIDYLPNQQRKKIYARPSSLPAMSDNQRTMRRPRKRSTQLKTLKENLVSIVLAVLLMLMPDMVPALNHPVVLFLLTPVNLGQVAIIAGLGMRHGMAQ